MVTNRSSPTICTRSPMAVVSSTQPSQSSSESGILDGHQRVGVEQLGVELGHLLGGAGLVLEPVAVSSGVELGGGHVERQRHIGAQDEPGTLDGRADQIQRPWCPPSGAKPPSSPSPVARPCFGAPTSASGRPRRPSAAHSLKLGAPIGATMNSWTSTTGVGVRAAVEGCSSSAPAGCGRSARPGTGTAAARRCPRRPSPPPARHPGSRSHPAGLVRRAVQVEQCLVDQPADRRRSCR